MSVRLGFISISVLILVFSFLRLYKIQDSLLFFNDIGRDFLVFQKWENSGKPPLLGPQNSALPFNQSPVYFYYLYIFYVITGHSLYSTIIASVVFHSLIMLGGCFLLRKKEDLLFSWLITWIILTINPQMILQHRYIWNPSFVAACITLAVFVFLLLREKFTWNHSFIFAVSLALATGFSYSAAPTLIIFVLSMPFFLSLKAYWRVCLSLVISLVVINLPLIFFEIRHNFTLTQLMLHYEKIEQYSQPFMDKLWAILALSFSITNYKLLFFSALFISILYLLKYYKSKQNEKLFNLGSSTMLFLTSLALLAIVPISVQPHYIFGVISSLAIMVAFLGKKPSVIASLVLIAIWSEPNSVQSYFARAWRTVEETQSCAVKVCDSIKIPAFVSLQSTNHGYHTGPEFRYLFAENGCEIRDIELNMPENSEVKTMLVVSEYVAYHHNQTAFNELTLFGNSELTDTIHCSTNLRVYVLTRN